MRCLCVTWLRLSPPHLFKAQMAADLTHTLACVICECNDSDCVPSSEEHFKADDSLTSLAERVAANAALKREKGEKNVPKLRNCQVNSQGNNKQETKTRSSSRRKSILNFKKMSCC